MAGTKDNPGVIAPPPLLLLAAIVLGLLLDWLAPAYILVTLLSWPVRVILAIVLIVPAAFLQLTAMRRFHAAGTHVEPWKASTTLVTEGIFSHVRNPMYVGGALLLVGLSILLASDWMLVMTVLFFLVLHVGVVRREERYLEAKFGDAYRAYKARVPRYGWPPVGLR